eukprot:TRINITY_DN13412_c0_g1_i1.p1 TRINITY_DN13412_c0_g1~~TRINITY_DN13412_c0_g1_i1.p1  ORF type:complete len:333 (+),score=59.59 TRINITY_DN13412_c0_g1_i1:29-1000(+)
MPAKKKADAKGGKEEPFNWPLTRPDIEEMITKFEAGKNLPPTLATMILDRALELLAPLPNVVDVHAEGKERVTIVGDTHGQFSDLVGILRANGFPARGNKYVFNGDFVDRGPKGCEIVLLLLAFFVLDPVTVTMNRGNHESKEATMIYGFGTECKMKYGAAIYAKFIDVFLNLPLATRINKKFFVVHAGLWRKDGTQELGDVNDLMETNRKRECPELPSILTDALWSDPHPTGDPGIKLNWKRGCGIYFGPDLLQQFLDAHGFLALVRSHEGPDIKPIPTGIRRECEDRLITVFSASNYLGSYTNQAAYMTLNSSLQIGYNSL